MYKNISDLKDRAIDVSGAVQLSNWSEDSRNISTKLYKAIKNDKTNYLLMDQEKKLNKKDQRYQNIDTDSNSLERVNILKEQSTLKSDYTIDTLKYILVFLMLSTLPLILQRNKIINEDISKILFVISGIVIIIYLLGRFILNRKSYHFLKTDFGRNPNLTNDPTAAPPESAASLAEDKSIAAQLNSSTGKGPIVKYLLLIDEHMKKSLDAKDYDTAGWLQTYAQDIRIKIAEGDECGGIRPRGARNDDCSDETKQYIEQLINEYDFNVPVQARIIKLKAYQTKLSQLIEQKTTELQKKNNRLNNLENKIDDYSSIDQIENEIEQTQNILDQLNNGLVITNMDYNINNMTEMLGTPMPSVTPTPNASQADRLPTFDNQNFIADDLKVNPDVIKALSVENNN